jgi:hypothetical protein
MNNHGIYQLSAYSLSFRGRGLPYCKNISEEAKGGNYERLDER